MAVLGLLGCNPGEPRGDDEETGEESGEESEGESGDGPFDPEVCGSWNINPDPAVEFPGPGGAPVTFVDVTQEAGLDYRQYFRASGSRLECIFDFHGDNDVQPNADCEPTWFTGGAAVADYDGDGWPDLYVTRLGAPDILFHNDQKGGFDDRTEQAGLADCSYTNGVNWADIDNDGDPDLLLSAVGSARHFLYVNQGDGTFVEEAQARGFDLPTDGIHDGESIGVGDYDLDGWLDLHVNEWMRTGHFPDGGTFGPRLLHNTGDGNFEDVTEAAGVSMIDISEKGVFGFSSTFVDLDDDGWPELAVASDFRTSRLFMNRANGTFSDGTLAASVNKESNAMGSSFGDFDGDGRLDWFVTSIAELAEECQDGSCTKWKGTGNRLYHNEGGGFFTDATDAAGVRDGAWAWGTSFFDFDNDADQDIVLVNGWPGRDLNGGFVHHDTRVHLWENDGNGVMTEVGDAVGTTNTDQGRAVLTFDYDRDGDLDIFVANHAGRPVLYQNEGGNDHDWLRMDVRGTTSNRDARGAVVRLRAVEDGPVQVRQVGVRSHFLGEGELTLHFGLGPDAPPVHELTVEWPASGEQVTLNDLAVNEQIEVVEP